MKPLLMEQNQKLEMEYANFEETVEMTTSWYRNYYEQNLDLFNFNISQIDDYENKADLRGASWVKS